MTARFAFLVHAISPHHRRFMGVRFASPGLLFGRRDGTAQGDLGVICELGVPEASGVVVGIPMEPERMLTDQQTALEQMRRAADLAGDVGAVGLGSLCAVVAGRGEALADLLEVPVTTGGAATAWALLHNTRAVLERRGGPVGVVGASGAVGGAVARLLVAEGHQVHVDHKRARATGGRVFETAAQAVAGCPVVVGAGPTGGSLDPAALAPNTVLVDVALPATLTGPRRDAVLVAGEAVSAPPTWQRGFWGWLYQVLAGYGPSQVFACLVEPLVLAQVGRREPYALGRMIAPEAIEAFGAAALALGFRPRLAQGWRELPAEQLALPGPSSAPP